LNSGLQALASTLEPEEIRDLRDQFDAMDVDRNGTITLEEIRHVRFELLRPSVGLTLSGLVVLIRFELLRPSIWSDPRLSSY
jgi:hypothetical protein